MAYCTAVVHIHKDLCSQMPVNPDLHHPRKIRPVSFGAREVELNPVPMVRVIQSLAVPIDFKLELDLPLQTAIRQIPQAHKISLPALPRARPSLVFSFSITLIQRPHFPDINSGVLP